MSLPKPKKSLQNSCSVIHDNVLYAYTPEAFQRLPLKKGGKWEELEMGQKMTGAVCVAGPDGLFVVGGTGGSDDYGGFQKYSYADGKWKSFKQDDPILKNRLGHAAIYIEAPNVMLVHGGSKGGDNIPGYETHTISMDGAYNAVRSHTGSATANYKPRLLRWDNSKIALVGSGAENRDVLLFNIDSGWQTDGPSLVTGLSKDASSIQAILVEGTDTSKHMVTFDLSVSPTDVKRYVLKDAAATVIKNSAPVTKAAKRDLTLQGWPDYDSKGAPTETRQGFGMAQDTNGNVVFSGGATDDSINMFNVNQNSWADMASVFPKNQQIMSDESATSTAETTETSATETTTSLTSETTEASTTTDASSSATSLISSTLSSATAEATSDAPAVGAGATGDGNVLGSNAILGITLGSIVGFLALLGILLLFLRRRSKGSRKRLDNDNERDDREFPGDEKDPALFGNGPRGGASAQQFRGHNREFSQESYSSMAILMGRSKQQKPALTRKASESSERSTDNILHKNLKARIGKPVLQDSMQHPALQGGPRGVAFDPNVAEPRPRAGPMEAQDGLRRSSGWNRYWSGGSALQILGFGGNKRATVASDQSSRYSDSPQARNPRVTQDSATVPPLTFDFRPEVNRVNSGSPIVAEHNTRIPFKDGVAGKIERPTSKASSGYSSGVPESINESWPPSNNNNTNNAKPWGTDRAPSSAYEPSFYFGTPLTPSGSGQSRTHPSGVSKQPQLAMASTSSDMSWLNLGDRSRV